MSRRRVSQLDWYPYDPAEEAKRFEGLTHAERGALRLVLDVSWRNDPPCTIADTPAMLENLLGADYHRLSRVILQHFTPAADRPGRLRCEWFAAIYATQKEKYLAKKKGGDSQAGERWAKYRLTKQNGQGHLFRGSRKGTPDSTATPPTDSSATSSANSTATKPGAADSGAISTASKEGFLSENPSAGAASPPAPPAEEGPTRDELLAWEASDPSVPNAIEDRLDTLVGRSPADRPLRAMARMTALRMEWNARREVTAL